MASSSREYLIEELRHAHGGDPWHGPSRRHVLADVDPEEARQPAGDAHSIWELVLHMHAWTNEVARRLTEGDPRIPDEGDWPPVPDPTPDAWAATLRSLDLAHDRLVETLRTLPSERLDERVGGGRNAPLGAGVTYRAMLHGLAQHDAYHTGQIAILKRLYRTPPSAISHRPSAG
jgi:uncharacterized damage-inducible protein DinB